jgi:hypothetical protein
VGEHELDRPRLGLAERGLGDDSAVGCQPGVLQHVERRVERAVQSLRVVPHLTVPAAVGVLGAEGGLAHRGKAWVVGDEVRAEPEPEADVAEVEALQQRGAVDPVGRDEAIEGPHERPACRGVVLRDSEGDEEQQRPHPRRPASGRPFSVAPLVAEEFGDPALLEHPRPLALPRLGRLVEQVALNLPAD